MDKSMVVYNYKRIYRRMFVKIEVFCPVCAAAGITRKLMEVESSARGTIYPYCKGCKKNIKIELPLKHDAGK